MNKKLPLLLAGFIVLYYLVHAAYDLPDLVHGNRGLDWLPVSAKFLLTSLRDIAFSFLYTLTVYLILWELYPAKKILYCLLFSIVAVLLVFTLNYQLARLLSVYPLRLRNFFSENLFFSCVYILYGIVFYFIRYAQYKEIQQKELLLQNRQSELSFLRSQVNPHFLFNSLNNIYALVYENSAQALPAIAGLSEMLRYMLYDNDEKVLLEKELTYIEQYIALQKLRFEHPIKASLQQNGDMSGIYISPLLLVPFVENAFKHGDFSSSGEGAVMTVNNTARQTDFYCYNKKGKGIKDASGGIGLSNVKRRLELLYPGKHTLEIEDRDISFSIKLLLIHEQ